MSKDVKLINLGDWYSMKFGYSRQDFCVVAIRGDELLLESPKWCLSSALWISVDEFYGDYHNAKFLGNGKPRLFGGWLRRVSDCWGTLYNKPNIYTKS